MGKFENKYHLTGSLVVLLITEGLLWVGLFLGYNLFKGMYNSFQFGNPGILYLIPLSAATSLVFWYVLTTKNKSLNRFADSTLLRYLVPEISTGWNTARFAMFRVGLALVLVGLSMPQYGIREVEAKSQGVEIVIAIDISNSMNAEDLAPSRLERAKLSVESLLKQIKGNRVGIVAFAGEADVLVPLTSDYQAIKDFMGDLTTGFAMIQGTSLAAAIETSAACFNEERATNKCVIIISDGENHEQEGLTAAEEAKKQGITIHCVGLGSAGGSPIPRFDGNRQAGYHKDKSGQTVISKLDEASLKAIAGKGGGKYIRGAEASFGLGSILDEINRMETEESVVSRKFMDYEDHFYIYLMIGTILLVLEQLMPSRSFSSTES